MIERLPTIQNCHMPFLTAGPDGEVLLLSIKNNDGNWRAHFFSETTGLVRLRWIGTQFTDECSPTAWYAQGWHFSFIGKMKAGGMYHLYRGDGSPLKEIQIEPVYEARVGFINSQRSVSSLTSRLLVVDADGEREKNFDREIQSVSYRADNLDVLIVTFNEQAIAYNLADNTFSEITTPSGLSTYKPTLFQNTLIHTKRTGIGPDAQYELEEFSQ